MLSSSSLSLKFKARLQIKIVVSHNQSNKGCTLGATIGKIGWPKLIMFSELTLAHQWLNLSAFQTTEPKLACLRQNYIQTVYFTTKEAYYLEIILLQESDNFAVFK